MSRTTAFTRLFSSSERNSLPNSAALILGPIAPSISTTAICCLRPPSPNAIIQPPRSSEFTLSPVPGPAVGLPFRLEGIVLAPGGFGKELEARGNQALTAEDDWDPSLGRGS